MCYSIMVETSLHKLAQEFSAAIDYSSFTELYQARLDGQPQLKIPPALDSNFADTVPIRRLIDRYQQQEAERLSKKIAEKQTLVKKLSSDLAAKASKTRQEKVAVAERALTKLRKEQQRLGSSAAANDSRVFMYYYAPGVISGEGGDHQIVPLRYQLRPAGSKQEIPSHINCFNARIDKLEDRHNWQRLFMKRHALVAIKSFFEWVPDPKNSEKSAQVEFHPQQGNTLWVPALWDEWRDPGSTYRFRSFAILTRDPPAEIKAVGHDRSPVFPRHDLLQSWLHPERYDREHYYKLFDDLEPVHFLHHFV